MTGLSRYLLVISKRPRRGENLSPVLSNLVLAYLSKEKA
jgi:hypothetical protein